MAPSRRKGASKAAAAAAARRQWKVGDLVLAKVKGFPAWPATVSEPEKWGYSADWKKVLVYFFGTQQIAFCNPADVEPFTEEKKESLLVKRHGKGSDFVRAVHEIIDSYEKLKRQEHDIGANCTDEVTETNENNSITEADDNKLENLLHKSGSEKEATSLMLRSSLNKAESTGDESDINSLADVSASASEKDVLHGNGVPSKEPTSNVVVTYSSRRKLENMQLQDCVTQRRVQPARRSRSSRVDTSRLQNLMLPRNDGNSNGDMEANLSRDRPGRRSKRLRKSPNDSERHDVDSPALVSNGSIGENDPETTTVSDTLGCNDGITVDSGCRSVQPDSAVENLERDVEFSQRLEFQSHAVIFKKKRKPNRKRLSNDTTESTARLEKIIASEAEMPRTGHTVPSDHEKLSERNSKEDGDEHLPLVKRARVRMGASPLRPSSAGEQHDNQVAERMSEVSSGVSKVLSESLNCEENASANGNLLTNKVDQGVSSPLNIYSVKKPQLWEVRKIQPFRSSVDGEAALPPSKRLHRALEAMSANVAENSQSSSNGPAAVNITNEYCSSSSGECFKVTVESKERAEVGSSKVVCFGTTSSHNDASEPVPLMAGESEKAFEEVQADNRPLTSDASAKHDSCKDAIEYLGTGDGKHINASSLTNHTPDIKDEVENLKEPTPRLGESGASCDRIHGSQGLVMHTLDDSKPESSKLPKPSAELEPQISLRFSGALLVEENSPTSPQKFAKSFLAGEENNCFRAMEPSELSSREDMENNAFDVAVKEIELAIKSPNAVSLPAPEKIMITTHLDQHMAHSNSISDDQLGDKAASATQSSSSVTDGLDSGPRTSPLNTSACNMSISDNNNSNLFENNGCSTPEAHLHMKKSNITGKWSSREGPSAALSSFEAILGTLTRSKESIARATYIAIDCAKLGVAAKVVDVLTRKLETESSLHRKVDLFFLVDSITQCSRGMKGNLGGIYPSAIQSILPRLLSAAAPPGSSYQENRRQCLKVLRVWQERRILPESIIRHHIRELDSLCCSASSGAYSRSLKTERSFDDPIREMEGMLVDEYGSNSSIQLPGFRMPPMLRDGDGGSDSDEENFEAVTPEHNAENPEGSRTSIPEIEKHRHILEDVDGELEMEDVAPSCEAEATSMSTVVDAARAKYHQYEHLAPPLAPPVPRDIPPSSPPLPVSPPPPPPPLPTIFPSSAIPCSSSSCHNSEIYMSGAKIKDDIPESIACQPAPSTVNSVRHHGLDSRDFHAHIAVQMPDTTHSSYSSQPMSHEPPQPVSNIQGADAALHKGFHLRPPHPAPSNQFSYVQIDQRMQSRRDVLHPPNPNRYHAAQYTENGDFYRDRGRMKPAPRDLGDCWRSPAPPFSGPCHPDIARRPYGPVSYGGPPREPTGPNHRWGYPPRAANHREFMTHRPPPGGPIPVASRGPNFWRPPR